MSEYKPDAIAPIPVTDNDPIVLNEWTYEKWGLNWKVKVWSDGDIETIALDKDGNEIVDLRYKPLLALKFYLFKHPYVSVGVIFSIIMGLLELYAKLKELGLV